MRIEGKVKSVELFTDSADLLVITWTDEEVPDNLADFKHLCITGVPIDLGKLSRDTIDRIMTECMI